MKRISSKLLFLAVALFALACSSLEKEGDELYEAGNYREAAMLYARALNEEPDDAEIKNKLQKARVMSIDRTLIKVRKLRQSSNWTESLATLRNVLIEQNKWDVFPEGAVAFTQKREIVEHQGYLKHTITKAVQNKTPLLAKYMLKHYALIISNQNQEDPVAFSGLAKQADALGKTDCENRKKNVSFKTPYYGTIVERICALFDVGTKDLEPYTSHRQDILVKSMRVKNQLRGQERGIQMMDPLERGLRSSPWYSPSGAVVVDVALKGRVKARTNRRQEWRVHYYNEQVPYTAYEQVRRPRRVSYTDYEQVCDGTVCRSVPKRKFKTEYHYVSEPKTKYRSEQRSHRYPVTIHDQSLDFTVAGEMTSELGAFNWAHSIEKRHRTESVEQAAPGIGLSSYGPKLINESEWQNEQARAFGDKMRDALITSWNERFCARLSSGGKWEQAETISKCLRSRLDNPPKFADDWFAQEFGIKVAQMDELVSLAAI